MSTKSETGKMYEELLKRGIPFNKCGMIIESIYSCAIEGASIPKTKDDWDSLVALIKQSDKEQARAIHKELPQTCEHWNQVLTMRVDNEFLKGDPLIVCHGCGFEFNNPMWLAWASYRAAIEEIEKIRTKLIRFNDIVTSEGIEKAHDCIDAEELHKEIEKVKDYGRKAMRPPTEQS